VIAVVVATLAQVQEFEPPGFHFCVGDVVVLALTAYYSVLFAYIILTLLQSFAGLVLPDILQPMARFVYDICEPFLRLFRGIFPAIGMGGMGLDLSPILAFIVLRIVTAIAVRAIPC
jgi:YggT family protein